MTSKPILLVEVTPSVQALLRSLLRRHGHDVVTAGTAIEAQARFHQIDPDLVVLDMRLPDGDGLDLIAEFLAASPRTRIVATTSDGSPRRIVQTMRAGACDVLLKPLRKEPFMAAIDEALNDLGPTLPMPDSNPVRMTADALTDTDTTAQDPLFDRLEGMTLAQIERAVIEDVLRRTDGSVPQAATRLDVSPSTIYRKLDNWAKADRTRP